jgi:hypothetical protein
MPRFACIFSFLSLPILLMIGCSEEPATVQNPPPPPFSGELKGVLRGDGILVPNNGYGNIVINLYKDGTIIQKDITDNEGNFLFSNLEEGSYRLVASTDFGYAQLENIAYADEFVEVANSITEKDAILDSLKYDFCPLKVGNHYRFQAYYYGGNYECYKKFESFIDIYITDSETMGDSIVYQFQGEQHYFNIQNTCNSNNPDSFYIISGYFVNNNSNITCEILSNGATELEFLYRGIHIYDGRSKYFLNIPTTYDLSFGETFTVNGQDFETLYTEGRRNDSEEEREFYFSYELGPLFICFQRTFGGMTQGYWRSRITLVDYD